jgi:FixJ family two-component response regulator
MPDANGLNEHGVTQAAPGTASADRRLHGSQHEPVMDRMTIGVVDDDAAVRRGLERLLGACGYHVETYESAREFLDHAGMNTADCILLDVRMPGMSGLDLYRRLTRERYQLPTIFISAHASPSRPVAGSRPTPRLLMKPFDEDALLDAIQGALQETPIIRPRAR